MSTLPNTPFQLQKVPILDGMCQLYSRPDSEYWWARFYHGRKIIRTSTKQSDVDVAKAFARQWYIEQKAKIANGFAPAKKSKSFASAMDKAVEQYEDDAKRGVRSAAYVKEIKGTVERLKKTCIAGVDIAAVDQGVWNAVRKELLKQNPKRTEKTLHQYKNVVHITLNEALRRHEIKTLPQFAKEKKKNDATIRTWFTQEEFNNDLLPALAANIDHHKALKSRWIAAAEELLDYVGFVAGTGLRVGEAKNVRFCDVTITKDKTDIYLEIRNIKGKRGENGDSKSFYGVDITFTRIIARHGLTLENYKKSTEPIFKEYHRDMFRDVLKKADLYQTKERTPRKRDLMSLRHSYICWRLLDKAPIYDIAANCRTSVAMIQNHYARHLSVLQSATINQTTEDDDAD